MKKSILSIIVLIVSIQNVVGQNTLWGEANVGASKELLYLPDGNAVYWRYGWQRKSTDTGGIVITGQFPEARYFSYNAYNDVSKSSVGSIADVDIKPDNLNNYTLYIVPEGTVIDKKNVLYFDKSLQDVSVILRYYLPNKNIFGNTALPTIEFYDVENKINKAAPQSVNVPTSSTNSGMSEAAICEALVSKTFYFNKKDSLLHSFNLNSDGTYPNKDNHYLTMPIVRSKKDDVCIVKFKAPGYPKSKGDYATSEVRYFSIGQGDQITHNLYTMADFEFIVNPDGFIYLMIADGTNEALVNKAKALKMNFMPWLVNEKMLLVYRNMLPNPKFKSGTNSVNKFEKTKPLTELYGEKYIGDYSPVGYFFSTETLLNSKAIPKF